ncbi:M10 family metallopeptidase C-terminal domain-containing protein [Sphingomonas sp.]|uniref:M10 family metallopeptidase C-terminal domain-containing protein n=1 Tax=Sphingomonas sp. TaxID=28214 RepID=UPI0035C78D2B
MSKEFLINTYAGQWQDNPDITQLNDGTVVVVWDSYITENDLDTYYIAAQHFTADGKRIGSEKVLAAFDGGQSTHASVTALKDGGYAVAWQTAVGESILDQTDVYTKTFDADGTARGAAVRAHGSNGEDQYAPSIAATANGGYTLTWSSYVANSGKKLAWDEIYTRTFDADGEAVSAIKHVNQVIKYDQHNSRATTLSNGNVLLTWESEYAGNMNPSGVESDAVRARIYSARGKALSGEFLLVGENDGMNEGIGLTDSSVDVAAFDNGRFVVSWYETVLHDDRDTTFELHAQIYNNTGAKLGQEITVRAGTVGIPSDSSITVLDDGGFVVAWDAFGPKTYAFEEIWARVYDANGNPLGAKFKVNAPSGRSVQENPEVQALEGGGFWVVYQSEFLDGDDEAIAGRIYDQGSFGADLEAMRHTGDYRALAGDDAITGTAGADRIHLGRGADVAEGGAGDDILIGGWGADRLAGGAGADLFVFAAEHSRADSADVLLDFESGSDRIDLSRIARAGTDFAWIGDAAFTGTAGELRFAAGELSADLDGDQLADLLIRVSGDPVLQADLIL